MKKTHTAGPGKLFLFAGLAFGLSLGAGAAPTLTSTPASISNTYSGTVQIDVGALTSSTAILRLYVDPDADGVVDPGEFAMFTDRLHDNAPEWSPVQFSDQDPAAGAITIQARSFLPMRFPYAVGTYIWEVEDTGNGSRTRTPFTVTQAAQAQSISGSITDSLTALPVPGALVILQTLTYVGEETLLRFMAISDVAGHYAIQVPASMNCSIRAVWAVRPGYVTRFDTAPVVQFSGASSFVRNVAITPGPHAISGSATYSSGPEDGQGVPGLLLIAVQGLPSGDLSLSPVFTDQAGAYVANLPAGEWQIQAGGDGLDLQGVAEQESSGVSMTVSGAGSAPALLMEAANAFFTGTLRDSLGAPAAGRDVTLRSTWPCTTCYRGSAITAADGTFAVGAVAPEAPATSTFEIRCETPLAGKLVTGRTCETISAGQTITGRDLDHLDPTSFIFGKVTGMDGTPLANVGMVAEQDNGCMRYLGATVTECDGTYALPAVDGNWNTAVGLDDFGSNYRNLDRTWSSRNILVAGTDIYGVDFFVGPSLASPAITGREPSSGREGSHVLLQGFGWSGGSAPTARFDGSVAAATVAWRSDLGMMVIAVPAGLAPGVHTITVTNNDTGKTSPETCFDVLAGVYSGTDTITGTITDPGAAGVADALVWARSTTGAFARAGVSGAGGAYTLSLAGTGPYMLQVIPPAGNPWLWAQPGPSAAPAVVNHAFASGFVVNASIRDGEDRPIPGAAMDAIDPSTFAFFGSSRADAEGAVSLVVPAGSIRFGWKGPEGSRYVARQDTLTISANTDLGSQSMNTGAYFVGSLADGADGSPVRASITARKAGGNEAFGSAGSEPCTGAFALAVNTGSFQLDIMPREGNYTSKTVVKEISVAGDIRAEFTLPLFDANLAHGGATPKVERVSFGARAQAGAPMMVLASGLAGATVGVYFSDGSGGTVAGVNTAADAARGVVITTVPAGAASGDLHVRVDGIDSAPVFFERLSGTFSAGAYTVSGTVTDAASAPAPGTAILLLRTDSANPDCHQDPELLGYAISNGSGLYGPLAHPGGDLVLLYLPNRATAFAPAQEVRTNVTGSLVINRTLANGFALAARFMDDVAPAPVAQARLTVESDTLFDTVLSDGSGNVTLRVPSGMLDARFTAPAGSRLVGSETSVNVPAVTNLGDVTLPRGAMLSVRAVDEFSQAAPLTVLNLRRDQSPWEAYGEFMARPDGLARGAIRLATPSAVRIEPAAPDQITQEESGLASAVDLVLYPSRVVRAAGHVDGYVLDAGTGDPLADIPVRIFADQGGMPAGSTSAETSTCGNGYFRAKVPSGDYFVQFNQGPGADAVHLGEYYYNALCAGDALVIEVTEGTTSSVGGELDLAGTVTGIATMDGQPLSGATVCASGVAAGSCPQCTTTGASGTYQLPAFPGDGYQVQCSGPTGLQCFRYDNTCSASTSVSVAESAVTPGVDFSFGCARTTDVRNDNMESGAAGWAGSGLWHLPGAPGCGIFPHSGSSAWYFGQYGVCDYDTGGAVSGVLAGPLMTNVAANARLSFWQLREVGGMCGSEDLSEVLLWVNGAGPTVVASMCDNSGQWNYQSLDLSPFYSPGQNLQVGFRFNSVDGADNAHRGWYIDDVRVFRCIAPDEVSPAGSARPLRVTKTSLIVEKVEGVTAYNVYVDTIGQWYSPTAGEGSLCSVRDWADNGDGTVTLPVSLPANRWVVVTATNGAGESAAGQNSALQERKAVGTWPSCSFGP